MCLQKKVSISYNSLRRPYKKKPKLNTTFQASKNETKHYTLQHVCPQQKAKVSCNSCNILFNKNTTLKLREYAPRPCSGSLHKLHTVVHCNTLQRCSTHCHTLQHTVVHCKSCNVLFNKNATLKLHEHAPRLFSGSLHNQHTAAHCNTLQHSATHCDTLWHTTAHCNTPFDPLLVLFRTSTPQHTATLCDTLQHIATRCNTLFEPLLVFFPSLCVSFYP